MRKLTVCGCDISAFTIVIPTIPNPAEKNAADFLQRVISASCGVNLPISDAKTEHSIVLGSRKTDPQLKWDGFRTVTDDNHAYLFGNIARGTLYAAYDFAEKYLGHRYFTLDTEKNPTEGEAEVPCGLNTVDNPAFSARRTTCYTHMQSAELSSHDRLNDCMPTGDEYGGGMGLTGECHTFCRLISPDEYYADHPEYFALRDGKRLDYNEDHSPAQLCLTNPDVLRIVTEKILARLREHPDTPVIELSQNDNEDYCTCEHCAAVDAEEESQSGTMIRFVNAVAEAVEKEFPHVLIRTFAYWYTRKPPKLTRARKNVLVRYCTMHSCCRHAIDDPTCSRNYDVYYKEMHEWQTKCDQMSVWDYITCWRSYIPPFPNLLSIRENIRFFRDCGTLHVLTECNAGNKAGGTTPELKAYLVGKLLWNPDITMDEYRAMIDEFLEAFYGPGWGYIRDYMKMEYETTADRHPGCMDLVDTGRFSYGDYYPQPYQEIIPDNYLSALAARYDEAIDLIDKAETMAETEEQRWRIGNIRVSLNYMEICCVAHDKSQMTPEEQAAHEAAVIKLDQDKVARDFRYNTSTDAHQGR